MQYELGVCVESQRPSLMIRDGDEVVHLITANGGIRIVESNPFQVFGYPKDPETKYRER